ncbi:MAG TPA: hypothetical protein VMH84_08630 [Xanthobacteraceae bacterium]|nr:hypothetical protein [Xanthobacteraceae bacterium]
MVKILAAIDGQGMPERKALQAFGQLCRAWHFGAADQDRNHRDTALERSLDFNSDEIAFVADSGLYSSRKSKPIRPDDSEQNVGSRQCVRNLLAEIQSGANIVNVSEDRSAAEMPRESIKYPAGDVLGVRPAI